MFEKIFNVIGTFIQKNPLVAIPLAIVSCVLLIGLTSMSLLLNMSGNRVVIDNSKFTYQRYDGENKNLFLVNFIPTTKNPSNLTFYFSDPVDPHGFEHFFEIVPKVNGTFSQGGAENLIVFTPEKPFDSGTKYEVRIYGGLVSKNNKVLLGTYTNELKVPIVDNSVQFLKDDFVGKVLQLPAGQSSKISAQKAKDSDPVTVRVYESTEDRLLRYLTYNPASDAADNYGFYAYDAGAFYNKSIDHKESEALQTVTVKDPAQDIALPDKAGIYYLDAKASNGEVVGSTYVVVNTTGIVLRQDDKETVLSAFDLKSGVASSDKLSLSFYNLGNSPKVVLQSDLLGVRTYSSPFDQRIDVAVARKADNEVVVVPVKVPLSQADILARKNLDKYEQLFVYTDRPIYKPKDTVKYRGLVRTDRDALYGLPGRKQVKVWMGSFEKPIYSSIVTTDDHGVFSGEYVLPDTEYEYQGISASTVLTSDDYRNPRAYASFEVKKYQKPEYEITTKAEKKEYVGKGVVKYTVTGKYFDGKPLKNETVKYSLYSNNFYIAEKRVYASNFNITSFGGMCGVGGFDDYYGTPLVEFKDVKLGEDGTAVVEFNSKDSKNYLSEELTLVAEKTDSQGNKVIGADKSIVYSSNSTLFFTPSTQINLLGKEVRVPFYAETLDGQKLSNTKVEYSLLVNDSQSGVYKEVSVLSGTATTDADGNGIVYFVPPTSLKSNWAYVVISHKDSSGNVSENRQSIRLFDKAEDAVVYDFYGNTSKTTLGIRSLQSSYIVGDAIQLEVNSPAEFDALLTLERGRVYSPRLVHFNKGLNTVSVPVTEQLSPSITPVFSYFYNGEYHTEGMSLNVPAMHKLLNVSLTTDKDSYKPQESAQIKVTVTDKNNNPVFAQLSLGIVDKAIYALRKNATPPIHSSFYFYRPRTTNASSSLSSIGSWNFGGRGGGGGGGGNGSANVVDTLYWNPSLSTNDQGEATITVPLKEYVTTWKAQTLVSSDATFLGQSEKDFLVTN